jgi:hypothetical protein
MAMTPLTHGDEGKENPSILASNDGSSWEVPPGLTNPLVPPPSGGGYNADTDLVYNDETNELWVYFFRYWQSAGQVKLTLMKSSDGVNWTAPEYLITWPPYPNDELSFAIVKQGADWHYWAEQYYAPYSIVYRHSTDGENWSDPTNVTFSPAPKVIPWHLDVIYVSAKSEYWMMFVPGGQGGGLFLAKSKDRLNWTSSADEILYPSVYEWDNYALYRTTFLYDSPRQLLQVWYSALDTSYAWHIGYTETNY